MKHITLPAGLYADIPYYLAAEEWAAQCLPPDDYFFAWQVDPSIICGRHQDIASEVDLDAAARAGVQVWRRKSGGGAVLADRNNVMFSHITPAHSVQASFAAYTGMVCGMLRSLGIAAEPTGRNDIAVGARKVAGNAFLRLPGRSIVHGTMLYDADFALMGRVLTPSRAKKESKGVVSVPSRVTTLRGEGLQMSCAEFVAYAVSQLCPHRDSITPTDDDLQRIYEIRRTYLPLVDLQSPGKATGVGRYIDGVGQVQIYFDLDSRGKMTGVGLSGDFFATGPLSALTAALTGVAPVAAEVERSLAAIDVPAHILGLSGRGLASLFDDFLPNTQS